MNFTVAFDLKDIFLVVQVLDIIDSHTGKLCGIFFSVYMINIYIFIYFRKTLSQKEDNM